MILGVDVSTSITGFAIIADDELVYYDYIDLRKKKGIFAKTLAIKEKIMDIYEMYQCNNEPGSWLLYELFEFEPEYIGATSARKTAGIKIPRGQKAKKVVVEHLLKNETAFKVEYTRHGNPKAQYFDMADAIVIARAGYKIEQKNKKTLDHV